jgi:hypothetical protein
MATRTISNTGGNWNATTTWVGGVVPVGNDDIRATSTSGNVTVNVATAALLGMDLSQYLGTITLNNTINLGSSLLGSTIFSATMSWAGTYNETNSISLNSGSGNIHSFRTNGNKLPYLRVSKGGGATTLRINDDINVTSLSIGLGNATFNVLGTYSVRCNHFVRNGAGGGSFGNISSTASTLVFTGPTASYTNIATANDIGAIAMNVSIDVGANGTFSTFSPLAITGGSPPTRSYKWISGNLAGTRELQLWTGAIATNEVIRLDFSAVTFSNVYYNDYAAIGTASSRTLILESDLNFENLIAANHPFSNPLPTSRLPLSVTGFGALKGGRLVAVPTTGINNSIGTNAAILGAPTFSAPQIRLSNFDLYGTVHRFSSIEVTGYDDPLQRRNISIGLPLQNSNNALITSISTSSTAKVEFTGTFSHPPIYTYFERIDASAGNPIYILYGGQTGSTNIFPLIVSTTSTPSSGGGGGSFTFVN